MWKLVGVVWVMAWGSASLNGADAWPEALPEGEYLWIAGEGWDEGEGLPLEAERRAASEAFEVRLRRTDGAKVPYEEALGLLTVTRLGDGSREYIKLERFRAVDFWWAEEDILYIWLNIGHAYSVMALYDAEEAVWASRVGKAYAE